MNNPKSPIEREKHLIDEPPKNSPSIADQLRALVNSPAGRRDAATQELGELLSMTADEIRFYRQLLRATLEHLSMGVSVVDADQRLVAWNRRYVEMFDYPASLITLGRPIGDVMRFNARRGLLGNGAAQEDEQDDLIARRITYMRNGTAYSHERELPDGTVIEIRGDPMPGGGFVTSYSDVTAYKRTQRQLQEINETLETRVSERTAELVQANSELSDAKLAAERANQAKTRFLASASHDLVQPLNAARLFVSSIDRRKVDAPEQNLLAQAEDSLTAAESLLGALLDISRLDAAAHELKSEHVELARLVEPLAAEFAALARTRGLDFKLVNRRPVVVHTDPRLLRRVLQNFLSNAVRYTRKGRILMGCRRLKGAVRIEVWDTGPGIAPERQREIFEEFRRINPQQGDAGLGLGLAIADRLARLMSHPIALRSWPGHGSVFSITIPLGDPSKVAPCESKSPQTRSDYLRGVTVLVLDNEQAVMEGMRALLESWGATVIAARDESTAQDLCSTLPRGPDMALVDYHLDDGVDGIQALQRLRARWCRKVPGILISADPMLQARIAARDQIPMLGKPIKPGALRALMSRILTQTESA